MPIQNLFTTTQLAHQIETIGLGILGPGSIPPRATKKYQNHLRVVFSFVEHQLNGRLLKRRFKRHYKTLW
jgi:hypothetical protein